MFTIADYDKRYRPYDKAGRELVNPSFVKLPINPKGDGLRTLLKYKRGGEVFCIWCLLLEKTTAEKQPENRGKLLNHKGKAASVAEIAEGISHDRRIPLVKYALSVLATMGWVECGQNEDIVSSECVPNITKVKLSEDKYTEEFESFWKSYPERWIPESDRHVKIGKDKAWEYWDKLSEQTQKLVLSVLPVFARTIPPKIVPDAWRWLRDKKWKDYSVPDEKPSTKPQQTQSLRDKQRAEWTKFIKEAPEAKLVAVYKENTYGLRWLISELRPEIKDNLGKG